jgi:hypothetical protein
MADMPVMCPRCGTISVGSLIIPPGAEKSLLEGSPYVPTSLTARTCPLCQSLISDEAVDLSGQLAAALSKRSKDDRETIESVLRGHLISRSTEPTVSADLERREWQFLQRLMPQGQSNILAFCSLVIAVATLIENITATLLSLPSQKASNARETAATSLELASPLVPKSISGPIELSGYYSSPANKVPWVFAVEFEHSPGMSARRNGFLAYAYKPNVGGQQWACAVDYSSHFRQAYFYLFVVLLNKSIDITTEIPARYPRSQSAVKNNLFPWITYEVSGPTVILELTWFRHEGSTKESYRIKKIVRKSLSSESLADLFSTTFFPHAGRPKRLRPDDRIGSRRVF